MRALSVILFIVISLSTTAQDIPVIKFPELQKMMQDTKGKTIVFNFWATWCRPCIVEMPHFEEANKNFKDQNVEVILVSLDFVENMERVKKFVTNRQIKSKVVLLDEVDYNSWIDRVDPSWSGAIPATIIINSQQQKKAFYEKEFKENELNQTITAFLKP
jgi:thiol-disulfide isomerase/thioredoxin